jgi:hypothetical protein
MNNVYNLPGVSTTVVSKSIYALMQACDDWGFIGFCLYNDAGTELDAFQMYNTSTGFGMIFTVCDPTDFNEEDAMLVGKFIVVNHKKNDFGRSYVHLEITDRNGDSCQRKAFFTTWRDAVHCMLLTEFKFGLDFIKTGILPFEYIQP